MLSHRARVDLGAIPIKGYSAFLIIQLYNMNLLIRLFSFISRTLVRRSYRSAGEQSVYNTAPADWVTRMLKSLDVPWYLRTTILCYLWNEISPLKAIMISVIPLCMWSQITICSQININLERKRKIRFRMCTFSLPKEQNEGLKERSIENRKIFIYQSIYFSIYTILNF